MYKKELPRNVLSTRIQSSTNSSPYSSLLKKNLIICTILIDFNKETDTIKLKKVTHISIVNLTNRGCQIHVHI